MAAKKDVSEELVNSDDIAVDTTVSVATESTTDGDTAISVTDEVIAEEEIVNASEIEEIDLSEALANMADEEDEEEEYSDNLTKEEREQLHMLLAKSSYRAHKVMKAKKSELKEMFREEHIITESTGDKVQTPATMLKEDMINLSASAQAQRILTGTIIGVKTANPDNKVATNLAIVNYGHGTCRVLIPDFLLINFNIENNRTPDRQILIKNRISAMIGTEIKFIVKQLDQKTKTAYADRLKAMEQEARNNYIRPLNNTGKPRVKVGDIVRAQVTAVSKNSVTVYALGSESKIMQNAKQNKVEVSWNYLSDCRQVFKPNMIVNVKVLAINVDNTEKYNEKYTLVATDLSIKQTHEDPQQKYFDEFNEGELHQATVTSVTDTGVYVVLGGKVDCLCAFPRWGSLPYIGESRVVEITQKKTTDESGNETDKYGNPYRRFFGVFKDV